MLDELRISGLGVIDDAVLTLDPGLTVLSGETGAGKTMLVTALLLLFGNRADPTRVRTGSSQATVDGRLSRPGPSIVERVLAAGGEIEDERATAAARRVLGRALAGRRRWRTRSDLVVERAG